MNRTAPQAGPSLRVKGTPEEAISALAEVLTAGQARDMHIDGRSVSWRGTASIVSFQAPALRAVAEPARGTTWVHFHAIGHGAAETQDAAAGLVERIGADRLVQVVEGPRSLMPLGMGAGTAMVLIVLAIVLL